VQIDARHHRILADEPNDKGGADTAGTPYELLSAALAACTSITLRMYAERKGWHTGQIGVDIDFETEKGVTKFKRRLSFENTLPDDQRERLLAVANACPVHKVLTGTITIETI
jgi:putative redox protein